MLKPPAGARVAIIEFEDLECPACAHSFPIVHQAAARYRISGTSIVRYDFPLRIHVWSFDAAVYARWFQDKVSLSAANDYRASVRASQQSIGGKEDLQSFTRKLATDHKVQLPFVIDPAGDLANTIRSDYALDTRLNVTQTPAIIVVTAQYYQQITGDPHDIYAAIEEAVAQTKLK